MKQFIALYYFRDSAGQLRDRFMPFEAASVAAAKRHGKAEKGHDERLVYVELAAPVTYYGFSVSNRGEQPAWFHTRDAATRFNTACGGDLGEIETTETPDPEDVLDTIKTPWSSRS